MFSSNLDEKYFVCHWRWHGAFIVSVIRTRWQRSRWLTLNKNIWWACPHSSRLRGQWTPCPRCQWLCWHCVSDVNDYVDTVSEQSTTSRTHVISFVNIFGKTSNFAKSFFTWSYRAQVKLLRPKKVKNFVTLSLYRIDTFGRTLLWALIRIHLSEL